MSILAKLDRHAGLMDRMAETLGVDIAEETMAGRLSAADYRNAVIRCTGCSQPGSCVEWVSAHPAGAEHAPDYCRNKARLEGLSRD